MLGKTEPRSSISSLVMIAADLSAKPEILTASGGEEGEAEELLLVVQRPLSSTRGTCPSTAALGLYIAGVMGCFQQAAARTRERQVGVWLSHWDARGDGGRSIPTPERVKSEALSAHLPPPDLSPSICVQVCPANTH